MAEGIYIAMGIRVFGVRGSKGTSTEQGITVALRNSMHSCPVTEIPEKQEDLRLKMEKQRMKTFRMVFLAIGSPNPDPLSPLPEQYISNIFF